MLPCAHTPPGLIHGIPRNRICICLYLLDFPFSSSNETIHHHPGDKLSQLLSLFWGEAGSGALAETRLWMWVGGARTCGEEHGAPQHVGHRDCTWPSSENIADGSELKHSANQLSVTQKVQCLLSLKPLH